MIDTVVAFVVLQVSTDELPVVIVVGNAVSDAVGGAATVTVAIAVAEPAVLVAVMV